MKNQSRELTPVFFKLFYITEREEILLNSFVYAGSAMEGKYKKKMDAKAKVRKLSVKLSNIRECKTSIKIIINVIKQFAKIIKLSLFPEIQINLKNHYQTPYFIQ